MTIGVVIPTRRERPEFFNHCIAQLDRQTRQPDRVCIVDYKPKSALPDIHQRYKAGYEQLKECDLIFFIEEDDYYSPQYIETLANAWGGEDLIGVENTIYYNIFTNCYQEFKHSHASMFCTAMKGGLKFPSGNEKFIDILLWKTFKGRLIKADICVGIKHNIGLIVSAGHTMKLKHDDPQKEKLRNLTHEDFNFYNTLKKKRRPLVAIVTGIWQRPDVFKLFADGVTNLVSDTDIDYVCIVAGSEGKRSRDLAEGYGYEYIEKPNQPLADKMNSTVTYAKMLNPDYVLCLGSDDVITPELMNVYQHCMKRGTDYIATTDFYFYHIQKRQAMYWGGYREKNRIGIACGAGRLLSRRLMKEWDWTIWFNKDSKGLDNSMETRLKVTPHTRTVFSMKNYRVYGIDIKSDVNMTPWHPWDNTQLIRPDKIKKILCVE